MAKRKGAGKGSKGSKGSRGSQSESTKRNEDFEISADSLPADLLHAILKCAACSSRPDGKRKVCSRHGAEYLMMLTAGRDREDDRLAGFLVRPSTRADEKFKLFHRANPQVYEKLVDLARKARKAGRELIGVGMLWEVMRWEYTVETTDVDFRLNNDYRSRYARLILLQEIDLRGIFEIRQLRS